MEKIHKMKDLSIEMSLYIHKSNQELLWNTIHKTTLIELLDENRRKTWFRAIVELFHNKHKHIHDVFTLQKINRETIQYMMKELSYLQSLQETPESSTSIQNIPLTELLGGLKQQTREPEHRPYQMNESVGMYVSREEEQTRKQEMYNTAFEEKQREYRMLQQRPPVPEVNFTEKTEDEPITNMDELIEQQRKEREQDFSMHYPPIPLDK